MEDGTSNLFLTLSSLIFGWLRLLIIAFLIVMLNVNMLDLVTLILQDLNAPSVV
jgi:hypothetical protein